MQPAAFASLVTGSSAYKKPFTPLEVGAAVLFALVLECGFFVLLVVAGSNRAEIQAKDEQLKREVPIAVKPVLDELPLLKLGGKRVRAKLPDMWKKQAPVKRYKAASAPSPKAGKTPDAIPTTEVTDAEAPPPDAELAKEVDPELLDATPDSEVPNLDEEGAADGVKEGTEADPLKARAADLYRIKITAWFNARFRPPADQIPCEELKGLSAAVSANVGPDRSVVGFSLSRPSGNPIFDAKVNATMAGTVGQVLPPPPPLYPDILGGTVFPVFSGKSACN